MSIASPYPRPNPPAFRSVHPRALVRSQSPPLVCPLPALPSPPRKHSFSFPGHGDWALSTHIIPAAFPRTVPYVAPSFAPRPPANDKPALARWARETADEVVRLHVEKQDEASVNPSSGGATEPLWCVVNRYVKTSTKAGGEGKVTLFLAHANSFPKEVSTDFVLENMSPE